MVAVLLVGAGGFVGSICRYGMSRGVQRALGTAAFPYGTFAVNIVGAFAIGLLLGAIDTPKSGFPNNARTFLAIGLLGGFTTFSAFGYETFLLFRESRNTAALLNITLQPALALAAVWLGHTTARAMA